MSTGLHRQAREYCEETCPAVDSAFSDALAKLEDWIGSENSTHVASILDDLRDTVKRVGTEKLRDALCSALRDKNDLEEERDELQGRVRDLESDVDDLEHQVAELERELAEVTS
jgi:chromosome segregation ATPase